MRELKNRTYYLRSILEIIAMLMVVKIIYFIYLFSSEELSEPFKTFGRASNELINILLIIAILAGIIIKFTTKNNR